MPGARVLVPFRNRAMLGIVLGRGRVPGRHRVERDIRNRGSRAGAFTAVGGTRPLGCKYYLAPVGDTFRAMLPPAVEMRFTRNGRSTRRDGRAFRSCASCRVRARQKRRTTRFAVLRNQRSELPPTGSCASSRAVDSNRSPFAKSRTHSPGSKPASCRARHKRRSRGGIRPSPLHPDPRSKGFTAPWRKTPDLRPWRTCCRKRVFRAGSSQRMAQEGKLDVGTAPLNADDGRLDHGFPFR